MRYEEVAAALGLGPEHTAAWADDWSASEDRPLALPSPAEVRTAGAWAGWPPDATAAIVAALGPVGDDPARRRLADHLGWVMTDKVGPQAPLLPSTAAMVPAVVAAALTPPTAAAHRRRGWPDEVSRNTLLDVGRQIAIHRRIHGEWGLATLWWLAAHFRGRLFALGRLQFVPQPSWFLDDGTGAPGPGAPTLDVHIPEAGPLTPASVDDSFERALTFVEGPPPVAFTCLSWMLDPRLEDLLPPDTNLVRFHRRWRLTELDLPGTGSVVEFVFRRVDADYASFPRRTTLERRLADHLAAGGTWSVRAGWIPVASA